MFCGLNKLFLIYERGKLDYGLLRLCNCKQDEAMYYCPAKNDFVILEKPVVVEREKVYQGWKKGAPEYEKRSRKIRQNEMERIG